MTAPVTSGGRPPAVSIVVPMFDVADYIGECVASLLAQTVVDDCEILLVDDGSTDDTVAVALAAAAGSPRVTVHQKANGGPGPGSARNAGLDLTTAAWILFCDGDDALTPNAVELLLDAATSTGSEVAVGAIETFPTPRTWIWSHHFVPGERSAGPIEDFPDVVHNAAPGNKLFRRSHLLDHGLRFAEGIHHQDTVLSVPALLAATRVAVVGDVVERYRKRGGSIMDSHFERIDNYWDHLRVVEELVTLLPGLSATRRPLLEAFLVRSFQGFALRAPTRLGRVDTDQFFQRAAKVYAEVSLEAIARWTADAQHRYGYAAMHLGDAAAFASSAVRRERVVVRRGALYLARPRATDAVGPLVRLGRATGTLTELVVPDDSAATDSATSDDSTGPEAPWELGLTVQAKGAPPHWPGVNALVLRLRPEAGGELVGSAEVLPAAGDPGMLRCRVDPSGLPEGSYELRLVFVTRTGQASCALVPGDALPAENGTKRTRLVVNDRGRLCFDVRDGTHDTD